MAPRKLLPLCASAVVAFLGLQGSAHIVSNDEDVLVSPCDASNVTQCEERCSGLQGDDRYLSDKCCIHAGKAASLLAFEVDQKWVPRLEEFNKCTGAKVRLEYLAEGEDGMADALRRDVGDGTLQGEGIFDAYIVQAPWLPPVVDGLANLSPYIRENADTVNFLDINAASRSAVSFNGTVRALPLDTDYVAIGWRQDVFFKHSIPLEPPKTIEELADLSELLNGLDHNDDGEPDWGVCLTPQVNYFYAFVAPVFQTTLKDPRTGVPTGQNLFFDTDTFEPLIREPGFRYALEHYWRIIRSSNCQTQLANGEECSRKTAFPTGRCAMVISMPGTLTSMLLDTGSRAPRDRLDDSGNVTWSIHDQPLGSSASAAYWGRRAPFPGSRFVQSWDRSKGRPLLSCDIPGTCPLADESGVNRAPFFAEGGEAYALNGRQSKPSARNVMWDLFAWLAELPTQALPLSGQYRKSHLDDTSRKQLVETGGWPIQMVDDLFELLGEYFRGDEEGGNPAQDLLMLGFSEYMSALDEELHNNLLGVSPDSNGGLFNKVNPALSIDPQSEAAVFNDAFEIFLDELERRYASISQSMNGGMLAQLQRWRQSLNLPWVADVELCLRAISIDAEAFRRLQCDSLVDFENLCQTKFHDVAKYDDSLCEQYYGPVGNATVILLSAMLPLLLFLGYVLCFFRSRRNDSTWIVRPHQIKYPESPREIGRGAFGVVLLAEYRGTKVAVKELICSTNDGMSESGSGVYTTSILEGCRTSGVRTEQTSSLNGNSVHSGSGQRSSKRFQLSLGRPTDDFVSEMRLLSKLRHPCIITIMGAVIDKVETPKLVMEFMELGSLYDVLQNKTVALDGDLLLPILQDITQGLRFLHAADPPIVHCDLKSKNILISSKYSAKVADFGLSLNKRKGAKGTPQWMAPELLCGSSMNTTASDIYSFGILLYEVYARKLPYDGERLSNVLHDVHDPAINKRPPVPPACPPRMGSLMQECLLSDPQSRPSFEEIDLLLQRISTENVDPEEVHLSAYARKELRANRANNLLFDVFPRHIAEALRDGHKVEPESHACVTVFFSDIVGFTALSESMSARKTCDMVDRLYQKFDTLTVKYDVFKIDVVGDAYMATTNLASDHNSDHVYRCAQFSIEAVKVASETLIDTDDPDKGCISIRVGFHTGAVISDVVGSKLPKFSVFGACVNVASRMESTSNPGRIQCSSVSAKILMNQAPELPLRPRGGVQIKGKGEMQTFWVNETREVGDCHRR